MDGNNKGDHPSNMNLPGSRDEVRLPHGIYVNDEDGNQAPMNANNATSAQYPQVGQNPQPGQTQHLGHYPHIGQNPQSGQTQHFGHHQQVGQNPYYVPGDIDAGGGTTSSQRLNQNLGQNDSPILANFPDLLSRIDNVIQACCGWIFRFSNIETEVVENAHYEEISNYARELWAFDKGKKIQLQEMKDLSLSELERIQTPNSTVHEFFNGRKRMLVDTWRDMEAAENSLKEAMNERLNQFHQGKVYKKSIASFLWLVSTHTTCSGMQRLYVQDKNLGRCMMWFSPLCQLLMSIFVYSWLGVITCGFGWIFVLCILPTPFVYLLQCVDILFINYEIRLKNDEIMPRGKPTSLQMLYDKFESEARQGV